MVLTQRPAHSVVPAGHTQAPAEQNVPPAQNTPHAPQLNVSVCVFTHRPKQSVWPAGHAAQDPAMQAWPAGQTTPHMPQLLTSLATVRHTPLQLSCPAGQTHTPAEHVMPAMQNRPHAPQLIESVAVLTHRLKQFVCPAGHVTQLPVAQTWVAAHAVPQLPQFDGSVCVNAQRPLHTTAPEKHEHTLALQKRPPVQTVPQPPQLLESNVGFTQRPEQAIKGAVHVVHAPPTHACPAPHTVPHEPQLFGSVAVNVHVPAHKSPPKHTQLPPEHA